MIAKGSIRYPIFFLVLFIFSSCEENDNKINNPTLPQNYVPIIIGANANPDTILTYEGTTFSDRITTLSCYAYDYDNPEMWIPIQYILAFEDSLSSYNWYINDPYNPSNASYFFIDYNGNGVQDLNNINLLYSWSCLSGTFLNGNEGAEVYMYFTDAGTYFPKVHVSDSLSTVIDSVVVYVISQ